MAKLALPVPPFPFLPIASAQVGPESVPEECRPIGHQLSSRLVGRSKKAAVENDPDRRHVWSPLHDQFDSLNRNLVETYDPDALGFRGETEVSDGSPR